MKLSKTELKQKISDTIDDEELVIELLEDIEDSMTDISTEAIIDETVKRDLEELKWKYDDLKRKYKERFLETKKEDIEDKQDEEKEELEEKEIIDVKEI